RALADSAATARALEAEERLARAEALRPAPRR
ncbi:flagellar biosynthesis protein FliJ, partial [Rhodobacter sphaeroides]|nr:flagellar biosynthesis protein FliJ [Cereibacter sphaeroides]